MLHQTVTADAAAAARPGAPDWRRVAYLVQLSRALDAIEETRLVPERKVLYQFSARGHDVAQVLLGLQISDPNDAACGYYRSRPLLLALGVDPVDALASSMAREGGYSDGRDIGAVFNFPNPHGASALPMCGGVGAQFTPSGGFAQAIRYRAEVLSEQRFSSAVSVALGGDGSVATNGFWAALTIATTQRLPIVFYIEDNGYGISVPSHFQTPGGDIAANLASFGGLTILKGDGADPAEAADLIARAVAHARTERAPVLLRVTVPRLQGHSAQDTQAYKPPEFVQGEWARDPLPRLKAVCEGEGITEAEWEMIAASAQADADRAAAEADRRPVSPPERLLTHVFAEPGKPAAQGGLAAERVAVPEGGDTPEPEPGRINMGAAIRRTLDVELGLQPRMVVFGEDVGPKGGVHAVTLGLQDKHGASRVFDTSLSEEGIIGRAVGMALAGLLPVPEIQFRKYADPAREQLQDCGTMRWRTRNRFAAPMVVRIAGGFFKCGDPWHSQTNEVEFVHSPGWKVAVPSNAEDAVGLLRAALRGDDPVIFFEHRAMLDSASARRAYPGDRYVLPFGRAKVTVEGDAITVVTWGAMVERCEAAAKLSGVSTEVIDLRTLAPWDRETVLASARRTRRCLVVHEDLLTAGFGAEVAAVVAENCFLDLDAPVRRMTMPDIPSPHAPPLLEWAVPSAERIAAELRGLVAF
jgi:2-oxoisovalerate dehydrogenase E1 component